MITYIRRKVSRWRERRTFRELGFRLLTYRLPLDGEVQFAEWLHWPSRAPVVTQEEVDFYRNFIREGDLVIDIGAHEGDTTVPMALAAGKTGTVLAIDANPHVFKVLLENARLNPERTSIVPLNFAVTAEDGEFTFGSGNASFTNGGIIGFSSNTTANTRYTFTVRGRRLQPFLEAEYPQLLPRLSFVKVDAEGYDKEVLKSIGAILARHRPVVLAECFSQLKAAEREELHFALASHDYLVHNLEEYRGGKRRALSPTDMTRWRHFDILGLPREKAGGVQG